MKNYLFLILLFCSCVQSQQPFSEFKAKETLRQFYKEYLTELSKWPSNYAKVDDIVKKYSTEKVIEKYNSRLGYDPLLNAQDDDISWLNSMRIKNYPNKNNCFLIFLHDDKNPVSLCLILENKKYKISEILE